MASPTSNRSVAHWKRITAADVVALLVIAAYGVWTLLRAAGLALPAFRFGGALALSATGYILVARALPWIRAHILWSLRNRLIVTYLFIAVVPVALLLTMAVLSTYLLYWQFGAYLMQREIDQRIDRALEVAENVANLYALEAAQTGKPTGALSIPPRAAALVNSAQAELPGMTVDIDGDSALLERATDPRHNRFQGLVQNDDNDVAIRAVFARTLEGQRLVVSVTAPVTPELIATLDPGLGPIQLQVMKRMTSTASDGRGTVTTLVEQRRIVAPDRPIPPQAHWYDDDVDGVAGVDAVNASNIANPRADVPVLFNFTTRFSWLNQRLFSATGRRGSRALTLLIVVAIVFLAIEAISLAIGALLTRTITLSVSDLYQGMQFVRAGDLRHRVRIRERDQLGELAESFNTMTDSVATLIEEQGRRQRLESDLAVAREVQAQLFPRERPSVPGVELDAVCRPARIVSGDYYDFIPLGPTRLGIAVADVSGKGVSAALLMASLQAALRSQAPLEELRLGGTAAVVSRLNVHLFRSSSVERYATFFYGVYDAATRQFEYTNAGHLPPLYIAGQEVRPLETGGTVLGLFEDCRYESETIAIAPDSLLAVYSDGLVEAENSRGEAFGGKRLTELLLQQRQARAHAIVESIVAAAGKWTNTAELYDDMTVVVARF